MRPGACAGRQIRIGIAARTDGIAQTIEKRLGEFLEKRRAKADRVRDALIDGGAVMRDIRRQVKQVARRKHRLVLRREMPQESKRRIGLQREIGLPP